MDPLQVVVACRHLAAAMDDFEAMAAIQLQVNRNDLRALNLLESGAVPHVAIARALHLSRSSVTVMVDRLEKAGLVRRLSDPHDRRSTLVELLPATWEAFGAVYRPVGQRVSEAATGWTEPEQTVVVRALDELTRVFRYATETAGTNLDGVADATSTGN